jgi:Zn-dependent metalloprotease
MRFLLGITLYAVYATAQVVQYETVDTTVDGDHLVPLEGFLGRIQHAFANNLEVSQPDANGNVYRLYNSNVWPDGTTYRYQQEFNGFEVFGATVTVHVMNHDHAKGAIYTGKIVPRLHQFVEDGQFDAMLSYKDDLMDRVKGQVFEAGSQKYEHVLDPVENADEVRPLIYVDQETYEAKVAFFVKFIDTSRPQPSVPHLIVDDIGTIIVQWEGLNTAKVGKANGPGGNLKFGKTWRNQKLVVEVDGDKCTLKTDKVLTVDLKNKYDRTTKTPYTFPCYTNYERTVNGGYGSMNDVHLFGVSVFDMYKEYYGSSPLKNPPLILRAHYGTGYDNAFFDGTTMTFGDGKTYFYPLTAIDVVGHEVSHGVTRQSSNLQYFGQSGGLNEAFSDCAGKMVERYVRGYQKGSFEWGVGYDITKPALGRSLRCMDDPPCDKRSIDHTSKYKGQDVHYTSGIYNKAFYLMAENMKNDLKDAFDLLYLANTRYWGKTTNFIQASELMLKCLTHMKQKKHLPKNDYKHIDHKTVTDALAVVGLDCKQGKDAETWTCKNIPLPKKP